MRHLTPLALALLLLSSPHAQAPAGPAAGETSDGAADRAAARAMVGELERSLQRGDPAFYLERFDQEALLDRALAGLPSGDRLASYRTRHAAYNGTVAAVHQAVISGGTYTFLRLHEEGEELLALFRLTSLQGLNYHDLVLDCSDLEHIRVVDAYIYLAGERLSQSIRRGYELEGDSPELRDLHVIYRLADAGRPHQALKLFRRLPEQQRRHKSTLLFLVQLASRLGRPEYEEALALFQESHPEDPALDLLLLDPYRAQGKFQEALACVKRLEAETGGDPRLRILRADILVEAGQLRSAREEVEQALTQDPDLLDGYLTLAGVAIRQEDHAEAARLFTLLETEKGFTLPPALFSMEPFATFLASPEGQAWAKGRRER